MRSAHQPAAPHRIVKHNLLATFPSGADVTSHQPKGDQDEKSIDWSRRRCSFCNSRFGAGCYRRPRLLRAILPRRKLSKSGTGQSVHRRRLLGERERYGAGLRHATGRVQCIPLSWRTEVQRLTMWARPLLDWHAYLTSTMACRPSKPVLPDDIRLSSACARRPVTGSTQRSPTVGAMLLRWSQPFARPPGRYQFFRFQTKMPSSVGSGFASMTLILSVTAIFGGR